MSNHIHAISIAITDDIEASLSSVEGDDVIDFTMKISDGTGDPDNPDAVLDTKVHEVVLMFASDDMPRMHHLFSDLAGGIHQAMEELRPVLAIRLLGRREQRDKRGAA